MGLFLGSRAAAPDIPESGVPIKPESWLTPEEFPKDSVSGPSKLVSVARMNFVL